MVSSVGPEEGDTTQYNIYHFLNFFSFSEHFRRFLFEMLLALQNINTFYQIPILVLPNVIEKEVEFRPLAWSKKTIFEKNVTSCDLKQPEVIFNIELI